MTDNLINRIIGYLLIFTALIGGIVCVYGIINVWRIKDPLSTSISNTFQLTQETLSATSDALILIEGSLNSTKVSITTLENTIKSTSRSVGDTTPILDSVITLTDEELPNTILSIQTALKSAQTSAELIENVLTIITKIPFVPGDPYDPALPLHLALGETSDSLEPLYESLGDIKDSLSLSRGNLIMIQAELNIIARHINDINNTLDTAITIVLQYQEVVTRMIDRLALIESNMPTWLNGAAWGISILLVWFIIIQLGLLMQGLSLVRAEIK